MLGKPNKNHKIVRVSALSLQGEVGGLCPHIRGGGGGRVGPNTLQLPQDNNQYSIQTKLGFRAPSIVGLVDSTLQRQVVQF